MALQSITSLANITLQSSSLSVIFSGIPQTYRDLILVSSVRSTRNDTADYISVRLNGDSGNNYFNLAAWADNNNTVVSNSSSTATDNGYGPNVLGSTATANSYSVNTFNFIDYSATDKHKVYILRSAAPGIGGAQVEMAVTRWASLSGLNSITLSLPYTGPSQFMAGSTFSLYGRIS